MKVNDLIGGNLPVLTPLMKPSTKAGSAQLEGSRGTNCRNYSRPDPEQCWSFSEHFGYLLGLIRSSSGDRESAAHMTQFGVAALEFQIEMNPEGRRDAQVQRHARSHCILLRNRQRQSIAHSSRSRTEEKEEWELE
ncbi:hypothetical protein J6590_009451 [Homalodisca vitripennis]|nr:hypothetical protein J6590_009451 [Homalodisca vitripennis]